MCVMSPPLTITREQIDEMIGILRQGIELAMKEFYDEVDPEKFSDQHQAWGG
jgi:hypothetical protein